MHVNGLKTAIVLGAVSAVVLWFGDYLWGLTGLVLAAALALVVNGVSYFRSDRLALRAMRAYPVGEFDQPGLHAMVRELANTARAPMPRLYISPTNQPNAFATGRNPRHAAVCVTEGCLDILTPRELRAVLGHELSHVHNRDILLSSVAAALATMITMIAWVIPMGSADDDDGPSPAVILAMLLLGPLAAGMIQLALGRSREFQADASAVHLTGDPLALASALRKIDMGSEALPLPLDTRLASASHLLIASPFRGGFIAGLFRTHPPMDARIARLEEMAPHPAECG